MTTTSNELQFIDQLVPSRPLDVAEQGEKLQRIGLDFLSSVHWVVIIVVALLFAAVVMFVKRKHTAENSIQLSEADQLIERGNDELQNFYFKPDGTINSAIFNVAPLPASNSGNGEEFANDDINERLNDKNSQKLLPQLRRFVKNGKLFSFFNSMASAKDKIEQSVMKTRGAAATTTTTQSVEESQQFAKSLRSKFGGDRLRNPLIDFQISDELKKKAAELPENKDDCNALLPNSDLSATLSQEQLKTLDSAFN